MADEEEETDLTNPTPVFMSGWNLNGQSWVAGHAPDGTPTLDGSTDVPRLTVPVFLFGQGTAVLFIPAFVLYLGADWFTVAFTGLICVPLWILSVFTAIKYLSVRKRILRLVPASEIALRLCASDLESVQDLASKLNLNPSYIVNGQPYYKASDFEEVALLLRPADSADSDTLVRSISESNASVSDMADRLVRPTMD